MTPRLAVCIMALLSACDRSPAPTQQEMNVDSAAAAEAAHRELQARYDSIARRLDGGDRARLAEAQRAWERYRDRNCAAEAALYEGGSGAPLMQAACLAVNDRARLAEIQRIYVEQFGLD